MILLGLMVVGKRGNVKGQRRQAITRKSSHGDTEGAEIAKKLTQRRGGAKVAKGKSEEESHTKTQRHKDIKKSGIRFARRHREEGRRRGRGITQRTQRAQRRRWHTKTQAHWRNL